MSSVQSVQGSREIHYHFLPFQEEETEAERVLMDVFKDRPLATTTQGFEHFFFTLSALSSPLNINSFKVQEWSTKE